MDVYPVTLTLADGTEHTKVKARIDGAGVRAWRWDRDIKAGVVVFQTAEPAEQLPGRLQRWRVGDVTLAKSGGCGCSSPLKRWMPPEGHVATAAPAEAS